MSSAVRGTIYEATVGEPEEPRDSGATHLCFVRCGSIAEIV